MTDSGKREVQAVTAMLLWCGVLVTWCLAGPTGVFFQSKKLTGMRTCTCRTQASPSVHVCMSHHSFTPNPPPPLPAAVGKSEDLERPQ